MRVDKLLHNILLKVPYEQELKKIEIVDIVQDTRKVQKGSCFVCIKGSQVDGHDLVETAEAAGASLIIAEHEVTTNNIPVILVADAKKALAQLAVHFYENPSQTIDVFGVTGTNGKTSITHMLEKVLSDHGVSTDLIGTMYNKIGGVEYPTINTTPDSLTNQKLLREMNEAKTSACAMEVSSHALVQGRVWGIDFSIAIFTNLTQDHLDFHQNMGNYFLAKSLLFSQLGNTFCDEKKKKMAIINIDDPYGKKLMEATAANCLTYGHDEEALVRATNVKVTGQGTTFDLHYQAKTYKVKVKMVGDFNVSNLLATFSGAVAYGLPPESVIQSLESITGVKGRFQLVPNEKNLTVIVDYAHTPDGLLNVLKTAGKITEANIYCVVGCGGDRDRTKRTKMAKIATEHATFPIFTSDNPRTEDPQEIIEEMVSQLDSQKYHIILDRKEAIHFALEKANPGDLIMIAGKGHEDYQIIGTTKYHFDDVEVAEDYFSKK